MSAETTEGKIGEALNALRCARAAESNARAYRKAAEKQWEKATAALADARDKVREAQNALLAAIDEDQKRKR